MTEQILTQERLQELLYYSVISGKFYWKKDVGSNVKAGDKAGSLYKSGYTIIGIDGGMYKAHRLSFLYLLGKMPRRIDHINHHKSRNMWINVRPATHSENMKNKNRYKNNQFGITGVGWQKDCKKYISYIRSDNEFFYLGVTEDYFEACCRRKAAETKLEFHENHGLTREGA